MIAAQWALNDTCLPIIFQWSAQRFDVARIYGRCTIAEENNEAFGMLLGGQHGCFLFFLGRRYDRCAMEIDNCKPLAMDFNGIYGGLFAEDTWPPLNGNG